MRPNLVHVRIRVEDVMAAREVRILGRIGVVLLVLGLGLWVWLKLVEKERLPPI